MLQNKLLKLLLWKDRMMPTNKLHNETKILQVNDVYNLSIATFVHKCRKNDTLQIFKDHFTDRGAVHNRNTRNRHLLQIPRFKRGIAFSSTRSKGVDIWNKLQISVTKQSYNSFRKTSYNNYIKLYN